MLHAFVESDSESDVTKLDTVIAALIHAMVPVQCFLLQRRDIET